jgi:hypothetical protein
VIDESGVEYDIQKLRGGFKSMKKNKQNNRKDMTIKIIVSIITISLIGSVWLFKNASQNPAETNLSVASGETMVTLAK